MYETNWTVYNHQGSRKYTTEREFRDFLHAAFNLPLEQKAFCCLVAFTGCRISEALVLRRACIGRDTVTLVTLKRRKQVFRTLQIPEALAQLLRALPVIEDDPERTWSVNRSTAYRWVKRAFSRAGIDGAHASPRGLRHGFGMRAANERVPPNLIQRWLGHAWATTTFAYLDAVGIEERSFASRTW